jgi:uncharacterized protein YndB with AHSA1/START domain
MSVRHDEASGRRYIELEVDVPGTPEQVWQAIATGPGFTAWFCPAEIEERVGGAVVFHMGPGMDTKGVVRVWDPPRRFAAEDPEGVPGAPALATEIFVEAKAGGVCRVRLVNSLFTSKADWDDQLEGMEKGWPLFFQMLRLYLTHFPDALSVAARVMTVSTLEEARAWSELLGALALTGSAPGQRYSTRGLEAPALAGVVERVGDQTVLLRTDEPGPGLVAFGANDCGPFGVLVWLGLHFYGDGAAELAAREEPRWQAWLAARFPTPAQPVEAPAAGGGDAMR